MDEKTKVTLIGKDYTGIGIVKSCRGDGKNFIMTIQIDEPGPLTAAAAKADPGVLIVNDFVSEEQEAKILEELGEAMASRFGFAHLRAVLRWLITPRGWAVR